MRAISVFFAVSIVMACLFAGCGEDEEGLVGPGGTEGAGGVAGLAALKQGSWAEHTSSDGSRGRMEFLGEDTWEGRKCLLMESESTEPGGSSTIMQIWLDKATGEPVLFLIKEDGKVMRMNLSQQPVDVTEMTGEIPVQAQNLGKDKYKTPTGKTVDVVKYSITTAYGTSEVWSSSEVPFFDVKDIFNGEVTSSLYDFGFSGAERSISRQEAENAEPFGFSNIPGGDDNIDDNPFEQPDGQADGQQPGGQGGQQQIGQIKITVGPGPRPTISVSEPVSSFIMTGTGVLWMFQSVNNAADLPGPFIYGVTPDGAEAVLAMVPDLVTGQDYVIQVHGDPQGDPQRLGSLSFTR